MTTWGRFTVFVVLAGAALAHAAGPPAPTRIHSPTGRYDLQIEPLIDDWTHVKKGKSGVVREAMEQYALAFSVAGSSEPVVVVYFDDAGPRATPQDTAAMLQWSPDDSFVIFPDRPHAWEPGHALQKVVGLQTHKVWDLEGDHIHWIDGHRFLADINAPLTPGGIILFDGKAGTADLLIPPDHGVGYRIAAFSGRTATLQEILNALDNKKTTWDHFEPACFTLDIDTMKKRSMACPR